MHFFGPTWAGGTLMQIIGASVEFSASELLLNNEPLASAPLFAVSISGIIAISTESLFLCKPVDRF